MQATKLLIVLLKRHPQMPFHKQYTREARLCLQRVQQLKPSLVNSAQLHWYVGDDSYNRYQIGLSTLGFNKNDNYFLADILSKEIGGKIRVRKVRDHRTSKTYYLLFISGIQNVRKFFKYLNTAPQYEVSLTKALFPWKFSKFRKKDFI